jgi:hypothetical protein
MATTSKAGAKKSPANVKTLTNKPAIKKPAKAGKPVPAAAKPEMKKKSFVDVKTEPAKTVKPSRKSPVTPEQRLHYVEVAAYYIAERRGFDGGHPAEDWAAAEAEIDRLLADSRFKH